jgi:flagellar hook-length control protein FliK
MQMQPINPLGSMVVGAKETRAAGGKRSTDSLFSSLTGSLPANTRKFAVTGENVEKFASKPRPGEIKNKDTTESSGLPEQTEAFSTVTAVDADRLEDVSDRRREGETAGEPPSNPAVLTAEDVGTVPSQQTTETTLRLLREHAGQPTENPPASDPEVASAAILDTIAQGGDEKKLTAVVDPSQAKGPKRTGPDAGALSDLMNRPAMSRLRKTAQQGTSSLSDLSPIAGLGQKTDDAGTQSTKPAGSVLANIDPAAFKALGDEASIILSEAARRQQEARITLPQAEGRLPSGISQTSIFHIPLINGGETLSSIGTESKFSALDLHLIKFVQNNEIQQTIPAAAADNAKTLQQAGTLLDAQFAVILNRPLDGLAEATTPVPSLRQRLHSITPEVSVAGADCGGATPSNLVLKMSEPMQPGDEGQKRFGKNHAWFSANNLLHQGQPIPTTTGLQAEFHHTLGVSLETTTGSITGQDISTARLPSGLFVPESQIIDHVIRQMAFNTTRNTISIKMHPEELGSLKMDLAQSEHGIRAHIQVQSQQVQDILEKYLYRLKESFEQQGLTLDNIQVSVNSGKNGGPTLFSEQHPHAHSKTSTTTTINETSETIAEEMVILQHSHEGYINLRI